MRKAFENKKIILGMMTVLLILGIVIVSSFWPFILDPNRIMNESFLSDELIITSIVLSVTISVIGIAQASNAANKDSELCKKKRLFRKSMKRITSRTAFHQWVKDVLQQRDRQDIVEQEMSKLGIPVEAYLLERKQILSLTEPQEIDGVKYEGYPINDLKRVLFLKKQIPSIKFVSPNYYTSVKSIDAGKKNHSQLAAKESIKKILMVVVQLFFRILFTWGCASVLGSLVRDFAEQGGNSAQAWMSFLSRMFAFSTSCFSGWLIGCKLNDADAYYIGKRVEVHTMYLEDSGLNPEPLDEEVVPNE